MWYYRFFMNNCIVFDFFELKGILFGLEDRQIIWVSKVYFTFFIDNYIRNSIEWDLVVFILGVEVDKIVIIEFIEVIDCGYLNEFVGILLYFENIVMI